MLLGSGDFAAAADQAMLEPHAFTQCAQIALRAMKVVPNSQAKETSFSINIHQGAVEAYIDFIDHLQEAIE